MSASGLNLPAWRTGPTGLTIRPVAAPCIPGLRAASMCENCEKNRLGCVYPWG